MRFIRKKDIAGLFRESKSTIDNRINEGLFPRPVSVGRRNVCWPDYEVEAMQKAWVVGMDMEAIKCLAKKLNESRPALAVMSEKDREKFLANLLESGGGEKK